MAIDHKIPELDRTGLRHFGLTTGAAVVVIFGLFFPWLLELSYWPAWPWIVAAPLWLLALVQPLWLRWIYRGWMRFGLLASRVMTPVFAPMGIQENNWPAVVGIFSGILAKEVVVGTLDALYSRVDDVLAFDYFSEVL